MEVTKQSWIKMRKSGKFDIHHLYKGLKLNPTFKMSEQELNRVMNLFQQHIMGSTFLNKIFQEAKMRLDKFFNIQTLHKANGEEIMIVV